MYKIAVIPGDGIGTEVINSGVEVLQALSKIVPNLPIEFNHFDWGAEYYKEHGIMMPDEGVDELKDYNAIYFGSAGVPEIPDHITLWGLRLKICQGLDQYANLRPVRLLPGIASPLKNVEEKDKNFNVILEDLTNMGKNYILVQEYIDEAVIGDKRIIVIDGVVNEEAVIRKPDSKDHRANLASGGTIEKYILNEDEKKIISLGEKGKYISSFSKNNLKPSETIKNH